MFRDGFLRAWAGPFHWFEEAEHGLSVDWLNWCTGASGWLAELLAAGWLGGAYY